MDGDAVGVVQRVGVDVSEPESIAEIEYCETVGLGDTDNVGVYEMDAVGDEQKVDESVGDCEDDVDIDRLDVIDGLSDAVTDGDAVCDPDVVDDHDSVADGVNVPDPDGVAVDDVVVHVPFTAAPMKKQHGQKVRERS